MKAFATAYRAMFAVKWRDFLHDQFDGPEHVAHVFGTDASTARAWWAGLNAPSGFAVGLAFNIAPEAAARSLKG